MSTIGLDIAIAGWEHPGLQRAFYPPDLPADWRLTYFANEFPAVMIPSPLWTEADETLLESWSDDVRDNFRFYLEAPETGIDRAMMQRAAKALGTRLAGLVCRDEAQDSTDLQITRFELLDKPGDLARAGCLPAWRVPQAATRDLRAARGWLDDICAGATADRGLLVIEGDDSDAEDLRRWSDLLWLMGLGAG